MTIFFMNVLRNDGCLSPLLSAGGEGSSRPARLQGNLLKMQHLHQNLSIDIPCQQNKAPKFFMSTTLCSCPQCLCNSFHNISELYGVYRLFIKVFVLHKRFWARKWPRNMSEMINIFFVRGVFELLSKILISSYVSPTLFWDCNRETQDRQD